MLHSAREFSRDMTRDRLGRTKALHEARRRGLAADVSPGIGTPRRFACGSAAVSHGNMWKRMETYKSITVLWYPFASVSRDFSILFLAFSPRSKCDGKLFPHLCLSWSDAQSTDDFYQAGLQILCFLSKHKSPKMR